MKAILEVIAAIFIMFLCIGAFALIVFSVYLLEAYFYN